MREVLTSVCRLCDVLTINVKRLLTLLRGIPIERQITNTPLEHETTRVLDISSELLLRSLPGISLQSQRLCERRVFTHKELPTSFLILWALLVSSFLKTQTLYSFLPSPQPVQIGFPPGMISQRAIVVMAEAWLRFDEVANVLADPIAQVIVEKRGTRP